MSTPRNLDISEDLEHQRKEWRVERIGWFVMLAVVIAGLAGVFGNGPVSHREIGEEGAALRVGYHRMERYRAQSELQLYLNRALVGPTARVTFSQSFNEHFRITEVVPEPEGMQAGAEELTFEFALTGTEGSVLINVHIEPLQSGRVSYRVGVEGLQQHDIEQFIFP